MTHKSDQNFRIIMVVGDSAIGFNFMEIETFIRYKIYPIICIINNGGIYHGIDNYDSFEIQNIPTNILSPNTNYHLMANIVDGDKGLGFLIKDQDQLTSALNQSLVKKNKLCILNIMIDPKPLNKVNN